MSIAVFETRTARSGSRALASSVTREAVVVALVVAWAALLAALSWGTWGDLSVDTGYDLVAAGRVAHGQLPYIDFDYWYGPLPVFLLGGVFALFGAGIGPAVAFGLVLSSVAIALAYIVTRRAANVPAAGAVAALTAAAALGTSNINFVQPHALSGPLATLFGIAALLALTGARRRPLLAGAALGLAAVTRVEFALALYAAVAIWFVLRGWRERPRGIVTREAVRVAIGAIAIPALVYGAFLTQISLHELVTRNLFPTAFLDQGGDRVLHDHAPLTIGSFAKLAGFAAVYAAGLLAIRFAGRQVERGGRARTLVVAALAIAAAGLLLATLVRTETTRHYLQYAYGWLPLGAAAAALTGVALAIRRPRAPIGAWVLLSLLVAGLCANTYADFAPFPKREYVGATAYLLPLAAAFMAWLHVRVAGARNAWAARIGVGWLALLAVVSGLLVIQDARGERFVVRGPGGSMHTSATDGPAYQAALDLIARDTEPGEPVLLAPQLTALYVLADRPDPLREISLLPGALTDAADERDAIARLADVRLAFVSRAPLTLYGQGRFGDTYATHVGAWLREHFTATADANPILETLRRD